MSILIGLAVRFVCLIAIGNVWGWGWSAGAIVLLALLVPRKTAWGSYRLTSDFIVMRLGAELATLIAGLIAASMFWGAPWAAAMLVIWVIGLTQD